MIKISGCVFSNNGVGISYPKGGGQGIDVSGTAFYQNGIAVQERDDAFTQLCVSLGLGAQVDRDAVIEILKLAQGTSAAELAETAQETGLLARVGISMSNAVAFAANTLAVIGSPAVAPYVASLLA